MSDDFIRNLEQIVQGGARDMAERSLASTPEEFERDMAEVSRRLLETMEKLIQVMSPDARFLWLTEYSPVVHELDIFQDIPDILERIHDFLSRIDDQAEEDAFAKLAEEDAALYEEALERFSLVPLYSAALEAMITMMMLRESMGDFD
jgi:hypothetical protein